MSKIKLTDREAKDILSKWPEVTNSWLQARGSGRWLRARPFEEEVSLPTLNAPGAKLFSTQPDGLWIYLTSSFADIVAIEVCGTIQNLNDKRSRYMPSSHSLMLSYSTEWLRREARLKKNGRKPRWIAFGTALKAPRQGDAQVSVPVRHLRVLYALPNQKYKEWGSEHIPAGHEYFCRHSSLASYGAPSTQQFLRRLSLRSHFLSDPKRSA